MKFGVRLRGENFEITYEGESVNFGFLTTRFVKADNQDAAKSIAVEMVRKDKRLVDALLQNRKYEPKVYLEEIWQEKWWRRVGGHGYCFFPMAETNNLGE